jgi:hypothetical protein
MKICFDNANLSISVTVVVTSKVYSVWKHLVHLEGVTPVDDND